MRFLGSKSLTFGLMVRALISFIPSGYARFPVGSLLIVGKALSRGFFACIFRQGNGTVVRVAERICQRSERERTSDRRERHDLLASHKHSCRNSVQAFAACIYQSNYIANQRVEPCGDNCMSEGCGSAVRCGAQSYMRSRKYVRERAAKAISEQGFRCCGAQRAVGLKHHQSGWRRYPQ